jgi:arylsulfatase A-like enzyme
LYAAFTIPHFSAKEEDKDGLTVPSTEPYSERNWDEQSKKYAAMIHLLDKDVGRIVELVNELRLTENTLIIFTSDNGGHDVIWKGFDTNGPLRGYKRDLTEGGIRVPFIVRWPGKIPAGKTSNEIIAFEDMLPTFAQLSGQSLPDNIDGISVIDAFLGNIQKEKHEYLYWDYGHCRDRYDQAVRLGNWKGIRLGKQGKIQLYNLENDIAEEKDLADFYPEIVGKMDEIMQNAVVPNPFYPIGEKYNGEAIWKKQPGFQMKTLNN